VAYDNRPYHYVIETVKQKEIGQILRREKNLLPIARAITNTPKATSLTAASAGER